MAYHVAETYLLGTTGARNHIMRMVLNAEYPCGIRTLYGREAFLRARERSMAHLPAAPFRPFGGLTNLGFRINTDAFIISVGCFISRNPFTVRVIFFLVI